MTRGRISAALRRAVTGRAGGRCEYCHFPQEAALLAFQVEHIVAEKHGGATALENLALACPFCNRFKGSDLGSLDPNTGELTPFYNPRTQAWRDHFSLDGARIVPLTAVGRVTVRILRLNDPDRVREREGLLALGMYP